MELLVFSQVNQSLQAEIDTFSIFALDHDLFCDFYDYLGQILVKLD